MKGLKYATSIVVASTAAFTLGVISTLAYELRIMTDMYVASKKKSEKHD